jgi:hypothetical protein
MKVKSTIDVGNLKVKAIGLVGFDRYEVITHG